MRNFGKIKLSNRDYERVVKRYIKFYKEENKCSNECPVMRGDKWSENLSTRLWEWGCYPGVGECFCCQLPMFPDNDCPCYKMGEKAFKALEKMVKIFGKEFM